MQVCPFPHSATVKDRGGGGDEAGGGASPRSHSFSKPRESLNAELARDDAATAESLAAAAASRASGLAGELQLRREVVMMPA